MRNELFMVGVDGWIKCISFTHTYKSLCFMLPSHEIISAGLLKLSGILFDICSKVLRKTRNWQESGLIIHFGIAAKLTKKLIYLTKNCLQATKKLKAFSEFDDDDLDMDNDSDDVSDGSDFDEDLDPDKIEVPGM